MSHLRFSRGLSVDPVQSLPIRTLTSLALNVLSAEGAMASCREELLDLYLLSKNQCTKQPHSTYRKLLLNDQSHTILKIVWKESPYVTDQELSQTGIIRQFPEGFNSRVLAKNLAEKLEDLDRIQSQVSRIIEAAEKFGLIKRLKEKGVKGVSVHGTEELHQYMLTLAQKQRDFIKAILAYHLE